MSHEALRLMAGYMMKDPDPGKRLGGKMLEEFADELLDNGFIAEENGVRVILPPEFPDMPEILDAQDFKYNTITGEIFQNDILFSHATEGERFYLNSLIAANGEVVRDEHLAASYYGKASINEVHTLKVRRRDIRKKLPVSDVRAKEILETVKGFGTRYNHFSREEMIPGQDVNLSRGPLE